jgi:hypothetical protein
VINDEIVNLSVAQNLSEFFNELYEEVYLNGINKANLLIVDEIRVVTNTIRQWPQALKESFVPIVNAYVINFIGNFYHFYIMFSVVCSGVF